jgi:hypothetical protein
MGTQERNKMTKNGVETDCKSLSRRACSAWPPSLAEITSLAGTVPAARKLAA